VQRVPQPLLRHVGDAGPGEYVILVPPPQPSSPLSCLALIHEPDPGECGGSRGRAVISLSILIQRSWFGKPGPPANSASMRQFLSYTIPFQTSGTVFLVLVYFTFGIGWTSKTIGRWSF
jgi:hypothetical protein